jgi:prepilin-type N-terminal cleavage/methylation domain-containing protein
MGRSLREKGFSLIEVLIAALIFLVVVIGVLPLFVRSIANNVAGSDYMNAANNGRSGLEQYHKLDFNDPLLAPAGTGTSATYVDYWAMDPTKTSSGQWVTTVPASSSGQRVLWNRTTTVRQYSVDALADGNLTVDEALPGGTDPIFLHLKEIRVQLNSTRQSDGLGPSKQVTMRVLKSF